jgi:hypothetical protein
MKTAPRQNQIVTSNFEECLAYSFSRVIDGWHVDAWNLNTATETLKGSGSTPGTCTMCGANFKTGLILTDGDTVITVGLDCAETFDLYRRQDIEGVLFSKAKKSKLAVSVQEILSNDPELKEALDLPISIMKSFREQLASRGRLSDRQIEVAKRILKQKKDESTENRIAAPPGRVQFTGECVAIKQPSALAMYPTYKAIIKVKAGNDVWLAMGPIGKQLDDIDRGDTVTMTATLKKGNDPSFVFYSRPSKVLLVKGATPTDELCSGAPRSYSLAS